MWKKFLTFIIFSVLLSNFSLSQQEKDRLKEIEIRLERLETTMKEFKEAVDKRFEAMDKRLDEMDKRFEQRFEQLDKRLEFIQNLMIGMLAVFGGMTAAFVGLLLWDRKTFKEKAKEESIHEVEEKYKIKAWIEAFKEYAKSNPKFAEILKKVGLL